jgi:hypothetical protein
MKKSKLNTEDGSEFTVFYLGEQKSQINECGVEGCCPTGHKGEVGEKGLSIDPEKLSDFSEGPNKIWDYGETAFNQIHGKSELHLDPPYSSDFSEGPNKKPMVEHHFDDEQIEELLSQKKLFWGSKLEKDNEMKKVKNIFKHSLEKHLGIELDDTIESDVVKEPVVGEIYRVKGLNKIVQFTDKPEAATIVSMTKNIEERVWRVQINKDIYFYLSPHADMLLKATASEKEEFNNESL